MKQQYGDSPTYSLYLYGHFKHFFNSQLIINFRVHKFINGNPLYLKTCNLKEKASSLSEVSEITCLDQILFFYKSLNSAPFSQQLK